METEQRHDPETEIQSKMGMKWLCERLKSNVRHSGKWAEMNGAMGDLGTYIPIALALTLVNGLDLGTTLIFTGAYNIITGIVFGVPMPVQPMKAIASVAIGQEHLSIPQIMAAGICTAGTLFGLGLTGLMGLLYRLIPIPVIRAIQLSQGLSFSLTAVKYIRKNQDLAKGKSLGPRPWFSMDGLLLALLCFFFIVLVNGSGRDSTAGVSEAQSDASLSISATSTKNQQSEPTTSVSEDQFSDPQEVTATSRKTHEDNVNKALGFLFSLPSALLVFTLGILLAILRNPSAVKQFTLGPTKPSVVSITKHDWRIGFFKAAVPQIPLSVLNSVIGLCKLSTDLFPSKEVTATTVSVSVGVMNLVGCWFGAMPVCHGAGGLAGQYKFGARSGASVTFLGTLKIVVGLLLGHHLVDVLSEFPVGLLGVLLLFSGIELAMACRDMTSKMESFVMLLSTAVSLTSSAGASIGFVVGILLCVVLRVRELGFCGSLKAFKQLLCSGSHPRWFCLS